MSTPQVPPPIPLQLHLGNTLGVAYLGIVFSSILFGVTCLQTFLYFQSQNRDGYMIKGLVIVLLMLDSTHQAFLIHSGYYYAIINFANPAALQIGVWSVISSVFLNAATAFLVECFLAYRLYLLSNGNKVLVLIVCTFIFAHLGTNFAWPIEALKQKDFSHIQTLTATAVPGLAIAVVADTLLSLSLSYYLQRSRTGFRRSDSVINKLISYTVTTGLITSIDTILTLIVYAALPQDFYFMFFNFMLSKLYSNSLLATLNTRNAVREAMSEKSVQSFSLSMLHRIGAAPSHDASTINPVRVHVETSHSRGSQSDYVGETEDSQSHKTIGKGAFESSTGDLQIKTDHTIV